MASIALSPAQLVTVRAHLRRGEGHTANPLGGDFEDYGVLSALLTCLGARVRFYGNHLPRWTEANLTALAEALGVSDIPSEDQDWVGQITPQGQALCDAVDALTLSECAKIEHQFDGRLAPEGAYLYLAALAGLAPEDFPEDAVPAHWS